MWVVDVNPELCYKCWAQLSWTQSHLHMGGPPGYAPDAVDFSEALLNLHKIGGEYRSRALWDILTTSPDAYPQQGPDLLPKHRALSS